MSRWWCRACVLACMLALIDPTSAGKLADRRKERKLQSSQDLELYTYTVRRTFPHDPESFTQGLLYYGEDVLYESAGMYGKSNVRKVNLTTGEVLQSTSLPRRDFAEGLTLHKGRLLQLTWQSPKGYVYDLDTLQLMSEFRTPLHDGWGFTNEHMDSKELVATDSGSVLYFLNADTLQVGNPSAAE
eukprot:9478782-Pyramimonas_sp.AAC.3